MVLQNSLFDAPAPVSAADPDSFGCCSRYRECSCERRCLIPDAEYSQHCTYRTALEEGRAFYGKNADAFSPSVYAEIRQRVEALSPAARAALDGILIDLCEYNRGARRCVVRNEHIAELSAVGLFDFSPLGAGFPPLCAWEAYLKGKIKKNPSFEQAKKKRKADRLNKDNLPGANTKDFAFYWLNHDGVSVRDALAEPYRFAEPAHGCSPYVEELYRDTICKDVASYDKRIYPSSPLSEDGVLELAKREDEELRRVQLSHGYSQEEKDRRISEIMEVRAVRAEERKRKEAESENVHGEQSLSHTRLSSMQKDGEKRPASKNPFRNKMCVITGVLSRMERADALAEIRKRGGLTSDKPVDTMDLLIVGYEDWSERNGGIAPRKIQKAADLQKKGRRLKIISEDEFYALLEETPF